MMTMMKRGVLVLGALTAIGAAGLAAQEDVAERDGRPEMRRGMRVETIMSMRDRLELTDAQIASLDELRSEIVQRRTTEMADAAEMRSRLEAGQIRRSEMMAFMEERRDANAESSPRYRERIEAILDEGQLESLRQAVRTRTRAAMRGRAAPGREQGPRDARRGPRRIG